MPRVGRYFASISFQTAASPLEYTHLVFPAWMSVGLCLGATYRIRWFDITLAYTHIFMPDRHVPEDQGQVFALRATADGGTFDRPAVNAGHFQGSYDILAVSLAFRLGPSRSRRSEQRSPER